MYRRLILVFNDLLLLPDCQQAAVQMVARV